MAVRRIGKRPVVGAFERMSDEPKITAGTCLQDLIPRAHAHGYVLRPPSRLIAKSQYLPDRQLFRAMLTQYDLGIAAVSLSLAGVSQ